MDKHLWIVAVAALAMGVAGGLVVAQMVGLGPTQRPADDDRSPEPAAAAVPETSGESAGSREQSLAVMNRQLEQMLAEKTTQMAALSQKNAALEAQLTELRNQVAEAEQQQTAVKQQLRQQSEMIDVLQRTVETLEDQISQTARPPR